jgi:hypothetical protein
MFGKNLRAGPPRAGPCSAWQEFVAFHRLTLLGFATSILWKRLDDRDRLLIICSSFGMMLEIALGSNDALSIRSGELFALFDVASALMLLSYLSRRATLTYVLILLCLGGIFFRSSTKIVKTYESRLFD